MSSKKSSSFDVTRSPYRVERRVLMSACKALGTVRALTVYLLAEAEEWDQYLALLKPDPEHPDFRDDYLVTSMMSKHPQLPNTTHDKRQVAVGKWWEAEVACRATNGLINSWSKTRYPDVFHKIQDEISAILGCLSRDDLESVVTLARFGPGATSSVSGRDVLPSRKFTSEWDVTPSLLPFYSSFVPHKEGYRAPSGRVVEGNKVTFVPKSAKTDRAIAIEPHANIYMQLGIGGLLRQRLLRTGYDLTDQKFRNRSRVLADKNCATIDLSSASDTVAYRLVSDLLPIEWVHLLDIARSTHSSIDGELVELQKFSSMGNGYTFELETLIFIAICRAVGDYGADVFGDDIIVERRYADDVIATLELLGFKVNCDKTFLAGRFFESCGIDVHDGVNVRPFYLKGKYESSVIANIRIANAVRLYAHRRYLGFGCDRRFLYTWLACAKQADRDVETFACYPIDNGLWRDFDECTPARDKRGWCGYVGRVLTGIPVVSQRTTLTGALVGALAFGTDCTRPAPLGTGKVDTASRSHENVRGQLKSHRIRTVTIPGDWYDLGAWI